jgi:hypothetical protein
MMRFDFSPLEFGLCCTAYGGTLAVLGALFGIRFLLLTGIFFLSAAWLISVVLALIIAIEGPGCVFPDLEEEEPKP